MNKEQAVNILIEAVRIAQQKGAFDLQSAKVVAIAVEILTQPEDKSIPSPIKKDDLEDSGSSKKVVKK